MAKEQASRLKDTRVRSVRRLTAGFLHHGSPVWSNDGHMLCFALGQGPDSHWLLTDRKGRARRVLPGPVVGGASIAPDHSVAYGRQVGATAEIWLLPAMDAQPQRLLGGDGRLYRDPAFSPDGRSLCYAADDGPSDSPLRLWILQLARGEHSLLVSEPPAIDGAVRGAAGGPAGGPARSAAGTADRRAWTAARGAAETTSEGAAESTAEGAAESNAEGAAESNAGLVRLGHPAWSADCEHVFFEVAQGEKSAVAVVEVASRRVQLLTGPGFSSPAPVAADLLCVERSDSDGQCDLCLLQYRAPRSSAAELTGEAKATEEPSRFKVRTAALSGIAAGAREPAAAVGRKGVVRLAWIAPGRAKGGEPQRYDVHAGQLARLLPARAPRAGLPGAADADAEVTPGHAADAVDSPALGGLTKKPKTRSKARSGGPARGAASPALASPTGVGRPGDGGRLSAAFGDEAPADAERGV